MSKGYFYVYPSRLNDYDIILQPNKNYGGNVPKEQIELYVLVKKTNSIIKNLPEFDFEKREKRKEKEDEKDERREDRKKKRKARKDDRQDRKEQREQWVKESNFKGIRLLFLFIKDWILGISKIKKAKKAAITRRTRRSTSKKVSFSTYKKELSNFEKRNTVIGRNLTKAMYANHLLHNAQAGLVGENARPELAIEAIKILKQEIVLREGGKIKNRNLSRLGACAFLIGFFVFALGYFLKLVSDGIILLGTDFARIFTTISIYPYLIVFAGAVVGAWIGYGVENKTISFAELVVIHKDRLKHIPRLVLFGTSGALLLLFFNAGIIELKLGNITNEVMMTTVGYQVLIGVIAGLLGNKLTTGLVEKATDLFEADDENEEEEQNVE